MKKVVQEKIKGIFKAGKWHMNLAKDFSFRYLH